MPPKAKKDSGNAEQVPFGESGGKFYASFHANHLERDKADFAANAHAQVEAHAINNGWLPTGDTELVDTIPDEAAPAGQAEVTSGVLVFAVPVERNGDAPKRTKREFGNAEA